MSDLRHDGAASPPAPPPASPCAHPPPSGDGTADVHANGCASGEQGVAAAAAAQPAPTLAPSPAKPPRPPRDPASSSSSSEDLKRRLCLELERKLRLASEAAELSTDRDAICGEAFSDVVGALDGPARAALLPPWPPPSSSPPSPSSPPPPPPRPVLYYEVLAPYLATHPARAEGLLTVCRRLWGQPYVAPLYALLLHRWLLAGGSGGGGGRRASSSSSSAAASGSEARHLLVLVRGAQQLFWADVHAGGRRFEPLFGWLAGVVVLAPPSQPPPAARLADLPFNPRVGLINVAAAFAPYYLGPAALASALGAWPSAAAGGEGGGGGGGGGARPSSSTLADPASSSSTSSPHHPSGAVVLLTEAADMLGLMKGEAGLLAYLGNLHGWAGCPALEAAPRGARLKLQAELYGLTARGGPRYLPASVREAAFSALDAIFPAGRAPRRAVAAAVRLWLHPGALPAVAAEVALHAAGWASGAVRVAAGAAGAVAAGLGLGGGTGGSGALSAAAPSTGEGMGAGRDLSRMMG